MTLITKGERKMGDADFYGQTPEEWGASDQESESDYSDAKSGIHKYEDVRLPLSYVAWAIRQISTGYFLPMHWDSRRGFSHDNPSPSFPRLFVSKKSARMALNAWLQGKWNWETNYKYSYPTEDDIGGPAPTFEPGRNGEDMEVIQVTLEIP